MRSVAYIIIYFFNFIDYVISGNKLEGLKIDSL